MCVLALYFVIACVSVRDTFFHPGGNVGGDLNGKSDESMTITYRRVFAMWIH